MKKLVFLFLIVMGAGLVYAGAASEPHGVLAPEAALPGYSSHEAAVIPDSVSSASTVAKYTPILENWIIDFEHGRLSKEQLLCLIKGVIALEEMRGIKNLGLYRAGEPRLATPLAFRSSIIPATEAKSHLRC